MSDEQKQTLTGEACLVVRLMEAGWMLHVPSDATRPSFITKIMAVNGDIVHAGMEYISSAAVALIVQLSMVQHCGGIGLNTVDVYRVKKAG